MFAAVCGDDGVFVRRSRVQPEAAGGWLEVVDVFAMWNCQSDPNANKEEELRNKEPWIR